MVMLDLYKSPRVYIQQDLAEGIPLTLGDGTHHYLKNVMRVQSGDAVRFFNGRDGEFVGRIEMTSRKTIAVTIENKLRKQINPTFRIHLLFPPLKKERFDWMVEKAVELGVTDLQPVLTQNTDVRKINPERIQQQIFEASEQCERLDIPRLHDIQPLQAVLSAWNSAVPLFAALERFDAQVLQASPRDGDRALLIGPPGGFSMQEKEILSSEKSITPVSLGDRILRTETAALAGLVLLSR